jgi:hypothetical protein
VADDEHRGLRALEQAAEAGGVPAGGVVEALTAGEGNVTRMVVLPGAVLLERRAVEVADVDVVEERLDGKRNVAPGQCDLRRLARARETSVDTCTKWDVRHLHAELMGFLPTALRQIGATRRISVHALFEVEDGLSVPGDDEEAHQVVLR